MGFKSAEAQIRTIPVYVVSAVMTLSAAWVADRMRHRYAFTMIGLIIAVVGYTMLLNQQALSIGVQYFALFLIMGGGFAAMPIILGWLSNTMSGHYKRSISSAVQIAVGGLGGFIASYVFFDRESPRYITGYSVSLAVIVLCALICTGFYLGLRAENKKRERGERDHRLQEEDADNLGDDHPDWRYAL